LFLKQLFKSERDYNYYTEPSEGLKKKLYWPRGRMLGGSSSMNVRSETTSFLLIEQRN